MRSEEEVRQFVEDATLMAATCYEVGEPDSACIVTQLMLARWFMGDNSPEIAALIVEMHKGAENIRKVGRDQERHNEN